MGWQIAAAISDEKNMVVLEIQEDGEGRAAIYYERPELEDLIRNLSRLRAEMAEPVPDEIDPGTRIEALADPKWAVRIDLWDQGPLLFLRHPGLGWQSFAIPSGDARAMAEWLTKPLAPRKKSGSEAE
jgi:hypothetical protein